MNRTLTTYLLLCTIVAFAQNSVQKKTDPIKQEKKITVPNNIIEQPLKTYDTTILNFDKSELILPLTQNSLTKVVMVKEKSKVDWLKYLLPILTLFLGIWIKAILEKRSDKEKTKKSGERWVAELRSLENPIKEQIKSLKKFLTKHEKEEFKIPRLKIFSSLNGEIFKSMDKNELIKFIKLNNSKKKFEEIVKISNRINGYVSILTHLHETFKEKFKNYLEGTSTYITSFELSLQAFNSAFRDYGVELERELNSDMVTQDINLLRTYILRKLYHILKMKILTRLCWKENFLYR